MRIASSWKCSGSETPKPGRLEFLRADSPRSAGRITREQFRSALRRILSESFPDATIESLTAAPDLEHSFSGLYVRGRMHEGSRGMGVSRLFLRTKAPRLSREFLRLEFCGSIGRGSHADRRAVGRPAIICSRGNEPGALGERLLALSPAARTRDLRVGASLMGRCRRWIRRTRGI